MSVETSMRDIEVTLRGPGAWQLYRAGAPAMLTLDMFPHFVSTSVFVRRSIRQWVKSARATDEFDTIGKLRHHFEVGMAEAGFTPQFSRERASGPNAIFLSLTYGCEVGHPDAEVGSKVLTFLENLLAYGYRPLDGGTYLAAMAEVWFELCDAALTVDAASVT